MRCNKHLPSDPTSSIGVCASCLRQRLLLLRDHSSPPPPPPLFPSSVSPYISRRKSDTDTTTLPHHPRFFTTPQSNHSSTTKSKFHHFFSNLFRSRSSSSSWIPAFIARRNKSTLALSTRRGRGMSPESDSTYSYSPQSWRRTPTRPTRVKPSPARSQLSSGIGLCLSPLVRPCPARHWAGLEAGYSGSLRANRSRKFADFGKFTHHR